MTDQAVDSDGRTGSPRVQFFGRLRELKSLQADVERAGLDTIAGRKAPRARVLLIAGRPGSGRSALAEQLIGKLAGRYPDGVLRARLTDPDGRRVPTEETARALLDTLGVAAPPGADEDELSQMVRDALAGRRAVLLLDDAGDAGQVDPLLPDNPDCLLVAVAEGPLTGIADVRPCTLGGMDPKAAIELLATFTGSVRITVDPQAAESVAEECAGQPAALVLVGGWLAARPKTSVADATKQLRALPDDSEQPQAVRPLARAFRLVYESLPGPVARTLRLLALAPAGLADAHTASALAGGSVEDAQAALDEFVSLGLLHPEGELYRVPGALVPLLTAAIEAFDKPGEVQLARARMLERTVRLLQSCRAVTEPEGSPARRALAGLPRPLRFADPEAAGAWLAVRQHALVASARIAVADGGLDTLARRLVAALVRALAAHRGTEAAAPELYGLHRLVLGVAERRGLHREAAAALLNLADLDAQTGRNEEALARYRAALDAGRAANDPYATSRAMESVGGAYQELGDWQRAADWYGRALAQRQTRGERADEARLYGRLGTAHTYAGRYGEALRCWRASVAGYRRVGDLPSQARALSEAARVQEYAGRPEESLHTCQDAVEWARQAGDVRLQAALLLRLADTLDRLGDPAAARLHREGAERLLAAEDDAGRTGGGDRGADDGGAGGADGADGSSGAAAPGGGEGAGAGEDAASRAATAGGGTPGGGEGTRRAHRDGTEDTGARDAADAPEGSGHRDGSDARDGTGSTAGTGGTVGADGTHEGGVKGSTYEIRSGAGRD
ncbi:tetratricopeptide repeat protein [Streptomyces sp. NPDC004609]|uniref:tetratricopeptide repeat protein n=1 Tax=Streptomyces sp. NPDC004609 TaxID=3364704 RepID=UPI0036BD2DFD